MEPSGGPGPGPGPVPGNNKGRGGAAAPGRGRDLARPPRKDSEVSATAGSGAAFPGGAGRAGPRPGPAHGCRCPGAVPVPGGAGACGSLEVPVSGSSSPAWNRPGLRCSSAAPRAAPRYRLPGAVAPGCGAERPLPARSCLVWVGADFPFIHPSIPSPAPGRQGGSVRRSQTGVTGLARGSRCPSGGFLGVTGRQQPGGGCRVPLPCSEQRWIQQEVTDPPRDTRRCWGHPEPWARRVVWS